MNKNLRILLILVSILGKISASQFNAKFVDENWNEKKVPEEYLCSDYNMDAGYTPEISLNNIPENTNKILLVFSDETFKQMGNGGHGIISYKINNKKSVIIPSIEGETFDIPKNFKSEKEHQAGKFGKPKGAYLSPCSGGLGNTYSVILKAQNNNTVLAKTKLIMGIY